MYQKRTGQVSLDENHSSFIGVHLNSENRWVKLAQIIPWDKLSEEEKDKDRNTVREIPKFLAEAGFRIDHFKMRKN